MMVHFPHAKPNLCPSVHRRRAARHQARSPVGGETIRATLKRLGIAWKLTKRWIRSPDPAYTPQKSAATG
jgi:hypothetical protein